MIEKDYKKHLILNQSGVSLINVLIFLAVISITVPVIFNQLADASKRAAKRASYQNYISFVQSMKEKLHDPALCRNLLNGQGVNPALGGRTNISLAGITFGNQPPPVRAGWRADQDAFILNRVYIQTTGNTFNNVRPWGSATAVNTIPMRVYFEPREFLINLSNSVAAPLFNESIAPMNIGELQITIYANVNAANRIVSCHGPNTQASACESFGGVYDTLEADPRYRCKPDKACFNSSRGIVSSPGQCPAPYNNDVQSLGRMAPSYQPSYICSWCHDPP